MQRIALTKSTPGMVLARPVCLPDGPVLAGEGVTLTAAVIERIRRANIGSIWVEGNPLGPAGDVGNLRKIAENLSHLFRRQRDNVFMMTLHSVFSRHFAHRIAEQQALEDAAIERKKTEGSGEPDSAAGSGK